MTICPKYENERKKPISKPKKNKTNCELTNISKKKKKKNSNIR